MMISDLTTWLKNQGFKRHPFEQLVADRDEDLEKYFQQFPFFEIIAEPKCTFLFLERGAGKSANRVYLQRRCDKSLKEKQDAKLSIAYTDFHKLIRKEQVTLADHVEEILREAVPRLYDVVMHSDQRGKLIKDLTYEYRKDFVWFLTRYSQKLSHRSIEKEIYRFEGLSEEKKAEIIKEGLKHGLDLVSTLAKDAKLPGSIALNTLSTLLKIGPKEIKGLKKTYRSPLDLMARFAEIAQQFDINHI